MKASWSIKCRLGTIVLREWQKKASHSVHTLLNSLNSHPWLFNTSLLNLLWLQLCCTDCVSCGSCVHCDGLPICSQQPRVSTAHKALNLALLFGLWKVKRVRRHHVIQSTHTDSEVLTVSFPLSFERCFYIVSTSTQPPNSTRTSQRKLLR